MKPSQNFDPEFLSQLSQLRKDLFDAVMELADLRTSREVRDCFFRTIFKVSQNADRAAILIDSSVWEGERGDREGRPGKWSDEMNRVVKTGETVVVNEPPRSAFGLPLVSAGSRIGVVWVESSDADTPVGQMDIFFMNAAATVAASALRHTLNAERLESQNARMREALQQRNDLIGNSPPMNKVREQIFRVAPSDTPVLIQGESGSGKEGVARAIHEMSQRIGEFVAINCSAIPDTLFESEMFGYEKGAFTGAVTSKKGFFEIANGGTLFLDEIGDFPLMLQPKLFRALQEGEVQRLGGARPIPVDVRVITATNRDLEAAISKNQFRPELFYRINVATIRIPPLRHRLEDIPALVEYFIQRYGRKKGKFVTGASQQTLDIFRLHPWPGNVRELQNVVEGAIAMGAGETILPADLPEKFLEHGGEIPQYNVAVNAFKRDFITQAFARNNGNIKAAAAEMGFNHRALYKTLDSLGLSHLKE